MYEMRTSKERFQRGFQWAVKSISVGNSGVEEVLQKPSLGPSNSYRIGARRAAKFILFLRHILEINRANALARFVSQSSSLDTTFNFGVRTGVSKQFYYKHTFGGTTHLICIDHDNNTRSDWNSTQKTLEALTEYRGTPIIETDEDKSEQLTPFEKLRNAVYVLYYSAHWSADRPVKADDMWEAVRDAAGFMPGQSPKPIDRKVASNPTLSAPYNLGAHGWVSWKVNGGETQYATEPCVAIYTHICNDLCNERACYQSISKLHGEILEIPRKEKS